MAEFANQYGINLPGIGAQWAADDQNALRKLLGGYQVKQMKREEENQNALQQYLGPAMQGDEDALAKVTAANPSVGHQLMTSRRSMAKEDRELFAKQAPAVLKLFGDVTDEQTYQQRRAAAIQAGISGADKFPAQFDPAFIGKLTQTAKAFHQPKYDIKEGQDGFYGINQEDPGATPMQVPGIRPKAAGDDRQLVEIYDEKSPTGTRLVPRAQASGQPGKPSGGLKIQSNGDGGFTVEQGRGGAGGSFGQPTTNKIEEQIINNSNRLSRVLDINQSFKPEYLTYGSQVSNWAAGQVEKLSPEMLGPERKKALGEYTQFRTRAYNDLNQTLKEMSGAAITPQEADRLLKVLGDPSGDSPTQFNTKVDGITKDLRLAQARLLYMRQAGPQGAKGIGDVSLSDMPKIIKDRAVKMETELRSKGVGDDQLADQIRRQISQEFGL